MVFVYLFINIFILFVLLRSGHRMLILLYLGVVIYWIVYLQIVSQYKHKRKRQTLIQTNTHSDYRECLRKRVSIFRSSFSIHNFSDLLNSLSFIGICWPILNAYYCFRQSLKYPIDFNEIFSFTNSFLRIEIDSIIKFVGAFFSVLSFISFKILLFVCFMIFILFMIHQWLFRCMFILF